MRSLIIFIATLLLSTSVHAQCVVTDITTTIDEDTGHIVVTGNLSVNGVPVDDPVVQRYDHMFDGFVDTVQGLFGDVCHRHLQEAHGDKLRDAIRAARKDVNTVEDIIIPDVTVGEVKHRAQDRDVILKADGRTQVVVRPVANDDSINREGR
jgi:hypothetical protein